MRTERRKRRGIVARLSERAWKFIALTTPVDSQEKTGRRR
jgi:hypothetical protein